MKLSPETGAPIVLMIGLGSAINIMVGLKYDTIVILLQMYVIFVVRHKCHTLIFVFGVVMRLIINGVCGEVFWYRLYGLYVGLCGRSQA